MFSTRGANTDGARLAAFIGMMTMASIAELRAIGATFETDEAVAIAQQLISTLSARSDADEGRLRFGPPYDGNVYLNEDGSVSCRGCKTTPTVSEVGIFLHALLPAGSPRVPGSLRHTIACALLNVNVDVPFDSLNSFSRDLVRHEHGVRADIVRRVLARSDIESDVSPFSFRDRLRTAPRLHAAPPRTRTVTAVAACLIAGLALVASGESLHVRPAPIVATQTAPIAGTTMAAHAPRVDVRRISMIHATRPAAAMFVGPQVASRAPSRGVLDRLHLGWLRTRISIRDDL